MRVIKPEGDLELIVLLRHGHLVVRVHIAVDEEVSGVQCSSLLSERCVFDTCQVLKQPNTIPVVVSMKITWRQRSRLSDPVNMPDPIHIRSESVQKHWPEAGRMILAHQLASGPHPFGQILTQSAGT